MKQCGVVTEVLDTTAKVLMQRHSSCGSCNACKMGQEDMKMEIEAINQVKAQVGQRVEVDMEGQNVLAAAFIVYIIPLFTLLLGIAISSSLLPMIGVKKYTEIFTAFIGFTFMAAAFIGIKRKEKDLKTKRKYVPIITEIVLNEEKKI
ncbi:SoxR reducing system RseC family protein [Clostridium formicaceticum]|uniref:Sigma E positive regulator RseC/MucC n=1 Tax=Clostridium formicaceticum TaxID=1497 RepID=A0AAC9RNC8_9CLOT|nr:SoxR reducing system RseC family protein [Clostridium formicaceticum]AOY76956.1 sigma E positive regulator RseC/MucC [Clostridium formicaceticum]ARE87440.1 SoxR reducing system protein RseC [Clostridium formicaceticum]